MRHRPRASRAARAARAARASGASGATNGSRAIEDAAAAKPAAAATTRLAAWLEKQDQLRPQRQGDGLERAVQLRVLDQHEHL